MVSTHILTILSPCNLVLLIRMHLLINTATYAYHLFNVCYAMNCTDYIVPITLPTYLCKQVHSSLQYYSEREGS